MMIATIICEDLFLAKTSGSMPCYVKCHFFCSLERHQILDHQAVRRQVLCTVARSKITFAGITVVPFVLGIVTCPVPCTAWLPITPCLLALKPHPIGLPNTCWRLHHYIFAQQSLSTSIILKQLNHGIQQLATISIY